MAQNASKVQDDDLAGVEAVFEKHLSSFNSLID